MQRRNSKDHMEKDRFLLEKHGPSYRIDLAYIGTKFHGFQSQITKNTVQDHIEKALATIMGHPCTLRGASRTDTGVHAEHQVGQFRTKKAFSEKWIDGLNALTPDDIGIFRLASVDNNFHPIYDSVGKIYRYRIWLGKCYLPYIRPYVWSNPRSMDISLLEQEAKNFVGTHDFRSFCASDSDAKSTIREIYEIKILKKGEFIEIWFAGKGFLKQMIRIMVGTLVDIARGKLPPGTVQKLLEEKKARTQSGITAPAAGLTLCQVCYDSVPTLNDFLEKQNRGMHWQIP